MDPETEEREGDMLPIQIEGPAGRLEQRDGHRVTLLRLYLICLSGILPTILLQSHHLVAPAVPRSLIGRSKDVSLILLTP